MRDLKRNGSSGKFEVVGQRIANSRSAVHAGHEVGIFSFNYQQEATRVGGGGGGGINEMKY
jgi:hypothetical protein